MESQNNSQTSSNKQATILLVDDDKSIVRSLKRVLQEKNYKIIVAADGLEAYNIFQQNSLIDIVLTDMKMPGLTGIELLKKVKEKDKSIIVIVITGYDEIEIAVEAMKQGAYDFLKKPIDIDELNALIEKALEKRILIKRNEELEKKLNEQQALEKIIGNSDFIKKQKESIIGLSKVDVNLLIMGESGTGKELVSDAIYELSNRKDRPYLKINMAALPENLVESELFGHKKGSFTGAISDKKGLFEMADTGTIFLDEINSVPLKVQPKLLRVLEAGEFIPVGSSEIKKVDVRAICASNENLEVSVSKGEFRQDLYYRISVVILKLKPLRERKSDILEIAYYYLRKFAIKYNKNINTISTSAQELLLNYSWPGNIRELENAIERTVIFTRNSILLPEDFNFLNLTSNYSDSQLDLYSETLETIEKKIILDRLKKFQNNKTNTAKSLGISLRTLQRKIKQFNNEKN